MQLNASVFICGLATFSKYPYTHECNLCSVWPNMKWAVSFHGSTFSTSISYYPEVWYHRDLGVTDGVIHTLSL